MSSWFPSSKRVTSTKSPTKQRYNSSLSPSNQHGADDGETLGRPSVQRAVVSPLATAHDAILSDLTGTISRDPETYQTHNDARQRPELSSSPIPALPVLSTPSPVEPLPTEDAPIHDRDPASSAQASARSTAETSIGHTEPLHDPFTGALVGVLHPRSSPPGSDPDTAKRQETLQFNQTKDELWTHLARIRGLQSEIASLHMGMEGIGSNVIGRGDLKRAPARASASADMEGMGDEWVDAEREEKAREEARDAEFTRLAESFEARRDAIDGIMDKLNELSSTLTTFHALPTPQIDLSFQSGARETAMSPIFRSPSPLFTSISSPLPSSPPPMSPTSPYSGKAKSSSKTPALIKTSFNVRSEVLSLSPTLESPISDDVKLFS